MSMPLNTVLRESNRLRRHLRELKEQIDGLPRLRKAHQAKLAKQEQALKDYLEALKKLKAANRDREVSLKSTHQQLLKYERQSNDMKTPKEVEAVQKEIAEAKEHIQQLEDEILLGMGEVEEHAAKQPTFEDQVKKAKAELDSFEREYQERQERLNGETRLATDELKKIEAEVPPLLKVQFDRLIAAFGADALAAAKESAVKDRNRVCSNCLTAVTAQSINELLQNRFVCCNNCGRGLFLAE